MVVSFLMMRTSFARCRNRARTRLRAIAAIAFDRRTMPVDGNIERVVSRLFAIEERVAAGQASIQELASTLLGPSRTGDEKVSRRRQCAGADGSGRHDLHAEAAGLRAVPARTTTVRRVGAATRRRFPRKAPKKTGTLRSGAAFVVTRGDELLVRSRPEKGLLGGMTEVPTSDWLAGQDDASRARAGAVA